MYDTMELVIYRKSPGRIRTTKAQRERLALELRLRCRVQRPELVAFVLGAFYKLQILTPATVKDRATRILDHSSSGWVIPHDCYNRERAELDPQSMANSITLWINKNLSVAIAHDSFSVVVEGTD